MEEALMWLIVLGAFSAMAWGLVLREEHRRRSAGG
jgi:hypothetical protein